MKTLTMREFQLQSGTLTEADCPIVLTRYGKEVFVLRSVNEMVMPTASEILWKGEHDKLKKVYDHLLERHAIVCEIMVNKARQEGECLDIDEMVAEYKEMNNVTEEYLSD